MREPGSPCVRMVAAPCEVKAKVRALLLQEGGTLPKDIFQKQPFSCHSVQENFGFSREAGDTHLAERAKAFAG